MKRDHLEAFSLSFLDVISCAFGAVVMLILIFKPEVETTQTQMNESPSTLDLFSKVSELTELRDELRQVLNAKESTSVTSDIVSRSLETSLAAEIQRLETAKAQVDALRVELSAMSARVQGVKKASSDRARVGTPDEEIAGIPVDRRYVIFVVDTSGSMKQIWSDVSKVMNRILEIHPKVDGFQVINDNGNYLISGYEKQWIQDTQTMRKRVLNLFSTWQSSSNSNPFEGIQQSLRDYRGYQKDLSIYVLGDDFTGANFDQVLGNVTGLNVGKARINGLSFISPKASTDRFGTLMRELSQRNDGAFLSMK